VINGNHNSNSNNNSSSILDNELFMSSTNDNDDDDDDESNENQDDLDFVGAGTLGDIMSGFGGGGGGERSSGSLLDHAFSIHHPIALSSSSSITSSPIPTSTSTSANSPPIIDGLVTKEGGELNFRFNCNFTPMERIALTANGNLQRIFSSYYDAPIHVRVDSCVRRPPLHPLPPPRQPQQQRHNNDNHDSDNDNEEEDDEIAIWDRVVHLTLHNHTTLCKATSIIHVTSPSCIQLIESGSVGLGQMFRYLNKLPTFSLLDAGRRESDSIISSGGGSGGGRTRRRTRKSDVENGSGEATIDEDDEFDDVLEKQEGYWNEFPEDGGMWRTYKLQCEEMTCLIHEEFHRDAWDLL
jgi:hypothetical protein